MEFGPALVRDHVINTPFLRGWVEGVFPNLEPLQSRLARRRRIVNLRKPSRDGTLMRWRDRVVGVVGKLRAANDVPKVRANIVSSLNIDNLAGSSPLLLADHVLGVHIVDWVVVVRCTQTNQGALLLVID